MESEECTPGAVPPPPPPLSQQQISNPGRGRKRGGISLMSSSVEAQVASHLPHHHDKVLRSHTRRGRGAGPLTPPITATHVSISTSSGISRRRQQRTSCCSSHTDEDEGVAGHIGDYGEVSVSLLNFGEERGKGKVEGDAGISGGIDNNSSSIITSNNNNKVVAERRTRGGSEAIIIPSSTSCFAPTNETKELCEQAGLLGGPTKTTTIHSGGTRLSSLCIPPHNDLATQQCRNNNAGEHSSNSNNSNDNTKNCSQKIAQGIADNNAPRSRRRSRQHGHHHHEKSTPPVAANRDENDDNVPRGRKESGDDDNDEMCGEEAASCELPGKPNAAQSQSSSSTSLSLLAHSSSLGVGASVSSSSVLTTSGTEAQVKSERGAGNKNGGKEEKCLSSQKRAAKEQQLQGKEKQIDNCESVRVRREVGEFIVDGSDLSAGGGGGGGTGALKVNKIGGHDGGWSAGEDSRQAKDKDGAQVEKKGLSSSSSIPSWSTVASSGGGSMPQKAGLKGTVQDEGSFSAAGSEQSRQSKSGASLRCVKKCASGGGGASKKQSASSSLSFSNNNNNNNISSGGKSVERKKAPVPAPMLLMNNLPYMGELTFDTRPRRGRKPKKADICHLISKNYGIQFPAGVTQATLNASSLPVSSKTAQAASAPLLPSCKKTAETVSSKNNVAFCQSRSLVPPTFCNRDVSIVPIIPTTWGSGGSSSGSPLSLPITSESSSKCSPSTSNLLKPLSSLAQQLILHHHQNPPQCSVSSTRSMATITSSTQRAISMFPLPTPSSFSQSHHTTTVSRTNSSNIKLSKTCSRETDYSVGEDEDENMMEVNIESDGGDEDGDEDDNQDSPLNLCMRDKTMLKSYHRPHEPLSLIKEESLDVRWSRSSGVGGAGASKGVVRSSSNTISGNSYSSDGANKEGGSSKRSMIQSSNANPMMKGGKSAKLTGSISRPSSSLNFSLVNSSNNMNICDSDSVSNLVSCRPSPSPTSSTFGNTQQSSKLSPNIFAISAHHLQPQGLEPGGKSGGGGKGKQGGQSRKKKEVNLRGDVSISAAGSPGSQSGSGGSTQTLSSIGGTLFGQSTAGINDGAEVSICKFKFTGGAKPCLQEKKMLSVDSGGNFRFYSDKTTGTGVGTGAGSTGKLSGKGQQQQLPLSSAYGSSSALYSATGRADTSQSSPSTGDGVECHYALSSLPKSAKSMSMCMPQGAVSSSGVQVQMSSSTTTTAVSNKGKASSAATKLSLPLIASSSSSSAAASNPYASLSISPTAEELQQLHLSMQDQVQQSRSSSRVSPYPSGGDYSYSSSNSCSSSDNCFGGDPPTSASVKSNSQASPSHSHNYRGERGSSSGKMKLKRKRRTRKSLMREKLEKTFKEKGFLIQTQQLESAEGATYCKFRQLRKFTRYLFRSWKDYLPDHVKEISDNNANNNNGALPGSEQTLPNSHEIHNPTTGQIGDSSNVQSIADDEGDLDEEDDGDEDDEADSEEQPRQRLISHENAIANEDEDEESNDDDNEDEDGLAKRPEVLKAGRLKRKGKHLSASGLEASAQRMDLVEGEDAESSKDDDNDDVELQVDDP